MTRPVKPVFWYQGLFMQPQHLQQADIHNQSLTYPFKEFMQPYFWGLCKLNVDEGGLKGWNYTITEGEFIFQDGTWVSIPENGFIQPRFFKDAWVDKEKPFKVYIGLKKWDKNGSNVRLLDNKSLLSESTVHKPLTRFIASEDPEDMKDLYFKGQEAKIKLLSYHLGFFWEDEIKEAGDYQLIPLSILEFNGQDPVLSKTYAPPVVTISASSIILQCLKRIRELVLSRCRILEEYKNPRGLSSGELIGGYFNFFLALQSLNRYLPVIQHILKTPHIHPWNAYGLLLQMIGELSSYTDRIDALGRLMDGTELLPSYDHMDPASCFHQAEVLIEEILSSLLVSMENIIHLVRNGNYFSAQIPYELFDSRNMAYIIIKTPISADEILDAVRRLIKVGSDHDMDTLIKRALPGLPLIHRTDVPPGLPRRPDMICFEVDRTNRYWQSIERHGNICIYWSDAPDNINLELVIVKP